jgi:hypothetical protein
MGMLDNIGALGVGFAGGVAKGYTDNYEHSLEQQDKEQDRQIKKFDDRELLAMSTQLDIEKEQRIAEANKAEKQFNLDFANNPENVQASANAKVQEQGLLNADKYKNAPQELKYLHEEAMAKHIPTVDRDLEGRALRNQLTQMKIDNFGESKGGGVDSSNVSLDKTSEKRLKVLDTYQKSLQSRLTTLELESPQAQKLNAELDSTFREMNQIVNAAELEKAKANLPPKRVTEKTLTPFETRNKYLPEGYVEEPQVIEKPNLNPRTGRGYGTTLNEQGQIRRNPRTGKFY